MEPWRKVFRRGLEPLLTLCSLEALHKALKEDSPRLLQGATTVPPPLQCVQDWPVEAACAIGFAGWIGCDLQTVAEVEEFFTRVCDGIDQRLDKPGICREFIQWADETPRHQMRAELLAEVEQALAVRAI